MAIVLFSIIKSKGCLKYNVYQLCWIQLCYTEQVVGVAIYKISKKKSNLKVFETKL